MKTYMVRVKEVHYQSVMIEAESKEDAIARIQEGEGDESGSSEYACTLDSDGWYVEEIE